MLKIRRVTTYERLKTRGDLWVIQLNVLHGASAGTTAALFSIRTGRVSASRSPEGLPIQEAVPQGSLDLQT